MTATPSTMPRPLVPIRYAKVRMNGRTRYLLLTRDDGAWLSGYEVGGRICEYADGIDVDRLHMIHASAVAAGEVTVTPMRMNLTYGELETLRWP